MKKTTRRQPTEAQRAAAAAKRAELCRRSSAFRKIVDKNHESALTGAPWVNEQYAGCMTINACLERSYQLSTGQAEFKPFNAWKKEGFTVSKGEKGFVIWSKPKQMKTEGEATNTTTGEKETVEVKFQRHALCYLFHAGQVTDANGNRPSSYRITAPRVLMIAERSTIADKLRAA